MCLKYHIARIASIFLTLHNRLLFNLQVRPEMSFVVSCVNMFVYITIHTYTAVADLEGGGGDVRPPKKKIKKEREGGGAVFRPSIKAYQHSFIRLLNVINHYIFLPVALPF